MELFVHPAVVPLLGFLVGLLGAVAGVGGGFFIVPYLLFTQEAPPALASGTSLVLVALNALSASLRNMLHGRILWKVGLILGAATLPGAALGPAIVQGVDVGLFRICFSVLLAACAAYSIVLTVRSGPEDASRMRVHLGIAVAVSLVTGFVASMFGVGGGIIHVPLMMFVFLVPAHVSTATSQFALLITSLVGAAVYVALGQVIWTMVLLMGPGIVLGAQAGVWVSSKIKRDAVRRAFAAICVVVAVEMLLKGLAVGN